MLTEELRVLYRTYAPEVHRFATYLSGDRSLADDIVSETFLRVWNTADPIRHQTVRAYLFTIARNVYRHEIRRRSRQSELDGSEPATGPGLHERVEQRQALDLALVALRQLPEADRTALLMRALDKTPYEEIAWTLGISVTAAKVKVHRARLGPLRGRLHPDHLGPDVRRVAVAPEGVAPLDPCPADAEGAQSNRCPRPSPRSAPAPRRSRSSRRSPGRSTTRSRPPGRAIPPRGS